MSNTNYHYFPLDPQLHEIRLLTLLPGSLNDPICCHLSKDRVAHCSIYNALSYVWGDSASASSLGSNVILDGHQFPVTTNLLSALRHLRRPVTSQSITLWVDAICINQADLDERNQQVAMMRDIYASAEQVVIWLGEEDESSIHGIFDAISILSRLNGPQNDEGQEEYRLNLMRQCSSFFFGLADSRPWFSRVWILQELALAKNDPLVVCGWNSVPWSIFTGAWKAIAKEAFTELGMIRQRRVGARGESRDATADDVDGAGDSHSAKNCGTEAKDDGGIEILAKLKLDVLDDLLHASRSKGGESLRKLLLISRTSQSTDPRDRIYALLGLLASEEVDSPSIIAIPVDYRKPTSEVYADAVSHIFSRGDGPYFLSGVFLPGISAAAPLIPSLSPDIEQPSLPSWVPDFSCQVAERATQASGTQFHPPAGVSASGAGADCQNGKRLQDGRTLQVEGLLVGVIEEIIPLGESLNEVIRGLPRLESVALAARQRSCEANPSIVPFISQFKTKEPLWRTLVSNKSYLSGYDTAPPSYEHMYLKLLKGHEATTLDQDSIQRSDYELCLEHAVGKRAFFTTTNGFVGTCIPSARVGDVVAIWFGSPVPFILRPAVGTVQVAGADRQTHSLIGASYVSGIMHGEMVDELYCEDLMDSTTFFFQ